MSISPTAKPTLAQEAVKINKDAFKIYQNAEFIKNTSMGRSQQIYATNQMKLASFYEKVSVMDKPEVLENLNKLQCDALNASGASVFTQLFGSQSQRELIDKTRDVYLRRYQELLENQ